MTPNETYVCYRAISTTDSDDVPTRLEHGRAYKATAFAALADTVTGEVINLPLHVARNPSWYFTKQGEFNPRRPELTQSEYIAELVRGNEGLDAGELFKLAQGEAFGPCSPIPYNGFTTLLSKDSRIIMRKDGVLVKGTKASRGHVSGCTYHWVASPIKNRDGRFAA